MCPKWNLCALLLTLAASASLAAADEPAGLSAPAIHRENIEWLDVWIPNTNSTGLPRILLIGDSITREYDPVVEKALKGKAFVARLATSKSLGDPALLDEITLVLHEQHFDIIHFNNGMHGHEYTEAQYAAAAPALIETLHKNAPDAKLICATTTPVRDEKDLAKVGDYTQRVIARNKIMTDLCAKDGIPVDDLFPVLVDHPEYYKPGGVHHVPSGIKALADHVTAALTELLKKP
ncbi:MAG: SGNH/GDSL hydrolase family protein [Phycisphaerae bacterium]